MYKLFYILYEENKEKTNKKHQTNPALQVLTLELSQLSDTALDVDDNKECEV